MGATAKQPNVIDMLAEALAPALAKVANKDATGTPTTSYNFGPGGIFGVYGVERDVFSTRVRPTGLLEVLPAYPSVYMTPLFEFITGFLADTGTEPDEPCESCVKAGLKKGCTQVAQFGRYCRETKELQFDRLMQRRDRSEPTDLRLLNTPFVGNNLTPGISNQNPFASETAQALLELGVSFENLLSKQVWVGNPANDSGTGYAEFPGLDILIGTGKVDALTNTACPSLDSDVKDFAYQDVCSGANPSIVETMAYLYRYCSKNARSMGMEPVDFRWAMREELFYELTSCWPCSYLSFRCTSLSNDVTGQIDAGDAVAMRDAMREGRYLIVDGKRIPVVLDDGIAEDTNTNNANLAAGEFASDIYLLPFSVLGNFSTLYLEYLDFGQGASDQQLARLSNDIWWTDAGKFLWAKSILNWCYTLKALIRPRIILRTPHLAGRIQNVKYVPLQHTREPFPTDGYFVDGGVSTARTDRTLYSEWD